MRILIVGSNKSTRLEGIYRQYLSESGLDTRIYASQSIFEYYYYGNILNKIRFRLGLSGIYKSINAGLVQEISTFHPDLVWVFKGMEIYPKTLKWIRQSGIKLVNYNPDNPFIFTGRGSGNRNISSSLELYDLHLTYSPSTLVRLKESGVSAEILPFGFDLKQEVFEACLPEPEIKEVCFLGNPDKDRASFISELAERGHKITVFGFHWPEFLKNPRITMREPVFGPDFWKVLRRYRVQLNLMRVHNADSHNMRTFEIPAVGGLMLAQDTADHRYFFTEGKEAFLFPDVASCSDKISKMMALSDLEAGAIRMAARIRSEQSGYSYQERSRYVAGIFERTIAQHHAR